MELIYEKKRVFFVITLKDWAKFENGKKIIQSFRIFYETTLFIHLRDGSTILNES